MSVRREKRRDPATGAVLREFWRVDVVVEHPDGRIERVRKRSPIQTRRGAEQYERELREALLNPASPRREVPTFEDFIDKRWWPTYPDAAGNRHTTKREKERHLRVHLKPAFGQLRLDEIKPEVIQRFFASLRASGLSPKSIKNIRATFRRVLASAVEWGEIDAIPPLPNIKVPEQSFDFLTPEESELVLAATRNEEERALLLFALHTGARAGEQIALRWGDIDWHSHLVIFRRSSTDGIVGPTKSGRERKVRLSATLEAALKGIKHLKGPLVFCNPDGAPLKLDQLHERLWGALRRSGLRKVRWHDLRHSFASQLMMKGVPIRQVQDWMGHSTINMTMRYAHLAPGSDAELIRVLDCGVTATQRPPMVAAR